MSVFINGVDKQSVDVNAVQVKQNLSAANSTVNKGVYDATLLETVDGDLAVGNIKTGVTIFGKAGTVTPGTLAEDVEGDTPSAVVMNGASASGKEGIWNIGNAEVTLVTKTLNFNATSLAFATAFANVKEVAATDDITLQLYMGGLLMQTSAELPSPPTLNFVLRDFKALAGAQECKLTALSVVAASKIKFHGAEENSQQAVAIAVGSVKLV